MQCSDSFFTLKLVDKLHGALSIPLLFALFALKNLLINFNRLVKLGQLGQATGQTVVKFVVITIANNHLSFLIALQRIVKLHHFLINETDTDPSLNLSAVNIQNLGKAFNRRIVVTHQLISHAHAVPCFNVVFVGG